MNIIKTKGQEKLEQTRLELKCMADHLWMREQADKSIWVDFTCPKCDSMSSCLRRKQVIEKEMNR